MKRATSLILALALCVCLAVPALAASPEDVFNEGIEISNPSTGTSTYYSLGRNGETIEETV